MLTNDNFLDRWFFYFDKNFNEMNNSVFEEDNVIAKHRWYRFIKNTEDNKNVLIYDVSGINEEDVKISFEGKNHGGFIIIEGKTETEEGTFCTKNRFEVPVIINDTNTSYYIKNGLLYIEIIGEKKNSFEIKKKNFLDK